MERNGNKWKRLRMHTGYKYSGVFRKGEYLQMRNVNKGDAVYLFRKIDFDWASPCR